MDGSAALEDDEMDMVQVSCNCGIEVSEEELLERLDATIAEYRGKPGALIPVLQIAQGIFGHLPEVAMRRIAEGLDKPYSEVSGVVTFYSYFSTVPRGRHVIRVCLGTACYVRGGKAVLEAIRKTAHVEVGGTTEDRRFTLEVARCFGACGLAPAIMIDDEVYHRVKPSRVQGVLESHASKFGGQHGQANRQP
ncbi:MAG TPA: NAD(P)H-dependent oxidoreductase subunit E [Polyangiaceae bacterium]|nr:NAD(P)H-dependent oxidoreductase subunit E [Polyangiaceae bacterium]HNZ23093.1 NAD(P)H-dependent oxidoreductase subunit E [Polyangiaceae bacterium]HOD21129.1 NAD(P)H-dependent oxidoreductase subunit E [Polyangiaceae bacterium]HOE48898.1 NAD(P)H-dependent oxidoreductase subunit E [Polyangiaceae bacterium]HOH02135.1 NAD(P)H-dependent oxidoreductase subunit E [Polyangiaceae bacterium]